MDEDCFGERLLEARRQTTAYGEAIADIEKREARAQMLLDVKQLRDAQSGFNEERQYLKEEYPLAFE